MSLTTQNKIDLISQFEKSEGYPSGSILDVIIFETAGTLSTTITNKYSGAVGLIQFLKKTLSYFGLTTDQVKAMTFEQQLDLVRKYLIPYRQKLLATTDPLDFYSAILYPAMIGKPDTYVMATKGTLVYTQNSGLDMDRNGQITKGDVRRYFFQNVDTYRANHDLPAVTVTGTINAFAMLLIFAGSMLVLC